MCNLIGQDEYHILRKLKEGKRCLQDADAQTMDMKTMRSGKLTGLASEQVMRQEREMLKTITAAVRTVAVVVVVIINE